MFIPATSMAFLTCFALKKVPGAGEMIQWLRTLAAFPKDPGSSLSTRMAAHNHL